VRQCEGSKSWIEWEDCSGPRRVRLASREIFESDFSLQEWARQERRVPCASRRVHCADKGSLPFLLGARWIVEAVAIAWLELEPSGAYHGCSLSGGKSPQLDDVRLASMIYTSGTEICMSVEHRSSRVLIRVLQAIATASTNPASSSRMVRSLYLRNEPCEKRTELGRFCVAHSCNRKSVSKISRLAKRTRRVLNSLPFDPTFLSPHTVALFSLGCHRSKQISYPPLEFSAARRSP